MPASRKKMKTIVARNYLRGRNSQPIIWDWDCSPMEKHSLHCSHLHLTHGIYFWRKFTSAVQKKSNQLAWNLKKRHLRNHLARSQMNGTITELRRRDLCTWITSLMIMKNRSKDNTINAWERIGIGRVYQLDGTLKRFYLYTGGSFTWGILPGIQTTHTKLEHWSLHI
jgi:hypothetical protein